MKLRKESEENKEENMKLKMEVEKLLKTLNEMKQLGNEDSYEVTCFNILCTLLFCSFNIINILM